MKNDYIKFPVFSILIFIISVIIGSKIGWVTEDYAPTIGLFGILVSVVYLDFLTIKIKKRKKK